MEVANPILTIKIGIMEVVIQRVRGHGSRDRKFITQKKVLEIANPIFDIKMRFWKSPSLFYPLERGFGSRHPSFHFSTDQLGGSKEDHFYFHTKT